MMKKVLKAQYEMAELEIIKLQATDVITTSNPEAGSGGNIDPDGWTSTSW